MAELFDLKFQTVWRWIFFFFNWDHLLIFGSVCDGPRNEIFLFYFISFHFYFFQESLRVTGSNLDSILHNS